MSETANYSGPFKQSLSDIGDNGINYNFVRKHEGYSEKMYVPVCTEKSVNNPGNIICFRKAIGSAMGKSGITIGTGFDLGSRDEMELRRMEIPEYLIKKLQPFLGKKKDTAVEALNDESNFMNPLTRHDINIIDTAVKKYFAKKLASKFYAQTGKSFSQIPGNAQTAIFSLLYQFGLGLTEKGQFKKIWEDFKNGNYTKVAEALESMTSYQNRRKDEASLLRGIIAEKK